MPPCELSATLIVSFVTVRDRGRERVDVLKRPVQKNAIKGYGNKNSRQIHAMSAGSTFSVTHQIGAGRVMHTASSLASEFG